MLQNNNDIYILGIESSCDDTSCAILKNGFLLSNVTANQKIHEQYGGVIPELASRDHQKNIVPVIDAALKKANITLSQISAIAVTRGPGLSGSLLVGLSFAKSLSLAINIPLIEVNHMQGHILAHFIKEENQEIKQPIFPFLCLTVSGGHTQIVKITDHLNFELLAETEDDAVGEAFDKAAKILGLPYPGGPLIDKYAQLGDSTKYKFPTPQLKNNNYSFSGVKTSFLYFIQEQTKLNSKFVEENLNDICASYQAHLIKYLLKNLLAVSKETGIKQITIAGGVSANSGLRNELEQLGKKHQWQTYIPKFEYCTDNAAMIAITGYYKYLKQDFCGLDATPLARYDIQNK
ncbi:MAG TPA: tRNA (adenosine(37)-N6)-threonylcarbamoyltransferase complex transferase subunit TsaD [Bacteroidia bacterium]|nr:tRNA (adenosine(37)-N6)-threonylcarbamoyltransferase complex transferase subunit TsaD [Bacteroidia bacterium]